MLVSRQNKTMTNAVANAMYGGYRGIR